MLALLGLPQPNATQVTYYARATHRSSNFDLINALILGNGNKATSVTLINIEEEAVSSAWDPENFDFLQQEVSIDCSIDC